MRLVCGCGGSGRRSGGGAGGSFPAGIGRCRGLRVGGFRVPWLNLRRCRIRVLLLRRVGRGPSGLCVLVFSAGGMGPRGSLCERSSRRSCTLRRLSFRQPNRRDGRRRASSVSWRTLSTRFLLRRLRLSHLMCRREILACQWISLGSECMMLSGRLGKGNGREQVQMRSPWYPRRCPVRGD